MPGPIQSRVSPQGPAGLRVRLAGSEILRHHARLGITEIPQLAMQFDEPLPFFHRANANTVKRVVSKQDLRHPDRRLGLLSQP